jgi:N-methylhydantoinase A
MYAEFMPLMASKGVDPKDFTMVAYGGAGPTHAFLLAREVGIGTVLVPQSPGTLCALGCLTMDFKNDFVATVRTTVNPQQVDALERRYTELEADARSWMAAEAVEVEQTLVVRTADMRYAGQSFEIPVTLPSPLGDAEDVIRRFGETYRAIYGFSAEDHSPIEVVNVRVTAFGVRSGLRTPAGTASTTAGPVEARQMRKVYHDGERLDVAVYHRSDLRPGFTVAGPVVVEQYDTTVFVVPEFDIEVDAMGNIIGRRVEGRSR